MTPSPRRHSRRPTAAGEVELGHPLSDGTQQRRAGAEVEGRRAVRDAGFADHAGDPRPGYGRDAAAVSGVEDGDVKVAILDDYENVALIMADWSAVTASADITVRRQHLDRRGALVERLAPFDVVCVMRERTPLARHVIERLLNLKMIAFTGPFNASIDVAAAEERGIYVSTTRGYVESTVELTWALILAAARRIVDENLSVRAGGWQTSIGRQLGGAVLGVLGLGRIGTRVAPVGTAFGMDVIAWSANLTPKPPSEQGRRTCRGLSCSAAPMC